MEEIKPGPEGPGGSGKIDREPCRGELPEAGTKDFTLFDLKNRKNVLWTVFPNISDKLLLGKVC